MKIAVLKHGAGNVHSVMNALKRIGAEGYMTDLQEDLRAADRIIIPGQGNAVETVRYLKEKGLDNLIRSLSQPILGICIGQQIFCEYSEEGNIPCLGIYDGMRVQDFKSVTSKIKVPHMGWNTIHKLESPLFQGLQEDSFVYYVHSFYVPIGRYTIATTEYGGISFSAAMQRNNFISTQFHPEKSGRIGEIILDNFLNSDYD